MITLQFVAGAGLGAELIEWYSAGDYSHVDLVTPTGLLGARMVGGVALRPFDYEAWHKRALAYVAAPPEVEGMFYHLADAQLGKPYDKTAIAGFAAGRDWRETDSWFCSELAAWCLEKSGAFAHDLIAPANKITPSALLLVLSAYSPVVISQ